MADNIVSSLPPAPPEDVAKLKQELVEWRDRYNALLRTQRPLQLKVSNKKALSLYGLGRFPVTLYKNQWKRLIEHVPEIVKFMAKHDEELLGT